MVPAGVRPVKSMHQVKINNLNLFFGLFAHPPPLCCCGMCLERAPHQTPRNHVEAGPMWSWILGMTKRAGNLASSFGFRGYAMDYGPFKHGGLGFMLIFFFLVFPLLFSISASTLYNPVCLHSSNSQPFKCKSLGFYGCWGLSLKGPEPLIDFNQLLCRPQSPIFIFVNQLHHGRQVARWRRKY